MWQYPRPVLLSRIFDGLLFRTLPQAVRVIRSSPPSLLSFARHSLPLNGSRSFQATDNAVQANQVLTYPRFFTHNARLQFVRRVGRPSEAQEPPEHNSEYKRPEETEKEEATSAAIHQSNLEVIPKSKVQQGPCHPSI